MLLERRRLTDRVWSLLPRGRQLPDDVWRRRHRGIVILLWAHAIGIVLFGIIAGASADHSAVEGALVALGAALASMTVWGRQWRAVFACLGLLSASAMLVHLSGGYIELHFHFFVMVALMALYQDWLPFLMAIGYVVLHHGIVGTLDPASVYNHPAALSSPWTWAIVHAVFLSALAVVSLITWRLNEQAQQALREAEAKYRDIFEQAADGLFLSTPDGRYLTVNPALVRMYGDDSPAALMTRVSHFRRDLYVDAARRDELACRLDRECAVNEFETEILRKDGTQIWVTQHVHAVRDPTGTLVGYEGSVQDVTEHKRIDQMKSDFVSFATHQLRTPLSGIKWLLELTADEPDMTPGIKSYVTDARASADRLIDLVNDLLNMSRLEQGGMLVDVSAVDLGATTDSVLDELTPLIVDRAHRFSVRGGGDVPAVRADAKLVRQIILNLTSNAIKYSAPGGNIAVRMSSNDDRVRWTIKDSGIGIPENDQRRLFEKFHRADNVLALETEGTGLGLYLVRLIVERLGGSVGFESAEGRGSTFFFTLPRVA